MSIYPSLPDLEMSIEDTLWGIDRALQNLERAINIYARDFGFTPLHPHLRRRLVTSKSVLRGIHTGLENTLGAIREVAVTKITPAEDASSCPVPSLREAQP